MEYAKKVYIQTVLTENHIGAMGDEGYQLSPFRNLQMAYKITY